MNMGPAPELDPPTSPTEEVPHKSAPISQAAQTQPAPHTSLILYIIAALLVALIASIIGFGAATLMGLLYLISVG